MNSSRIDERCFEFADIPHNLRNQSKCSRRIPCTEMYGIERASSIGPKLMGKSAYKKKNPNLLRNLKHELKVGLPKTVLARYVNCLLNM